MIVNGVEGDESEAIAHPYLIDFDVGVGGNGVLQVNDVRNDYGVDVVFVLVQIIVGTNMHYLIKHTCE